MTPAAQTDVILLNEDKTVMVTLWMAGNVVVNAAVATRKTGAAVWSPPVVVEKA
jgi:hypothetical protein